MPGEPALQILVYGIDGHRSCFVQQDPATAQSIVEQIHPSRLFTQPNIAIRDDHCTTVFPCSAVARIDLIGQGYPGWPFPRNLEDVIEITAADFQQRLQSEDLRTWRTGPAAPGQSVLAMMEIALLNAPPVYAEMAVCVPDATAIDRSVLMHQIIAAPVHYMRRRPGGAILINPAQIARFNLYPGPPVVPGAWPARLIDE